MCVEGLFGCLPPSGLNSGRHGHATDTSSWEPIGAAGHRHGYPPELDAGTVGLGVCGRGGTVTGEPSTHLVDRDRSGGATPGKRRSAQRWPDIPRWCRSAAQHGPGRSRQVRGQRGGGPSRWAIPVKGGEGHMARRAGRNISRGSWDLGWHLRVGGGQGRQDLSVGRYRNKGGFSEIWFEQQPHRGHDPHDRWVLPDPGLLELAQDLLKPSCCPDVAARRAAIRTLFRLRGSVTRCTRSAGEPRAWDPGQDRSPTEVRQATMNLVKRPAFPGPLLLAAAVALMAAGGCSRGTPTAAPTVTKTVTAAPSIVVFDPTTSGKALAARIAARAKADKPSDKVRRCHVRELPQPPGRDKHRLPHDGQWREGCCSCHLHREQWALRAVEYQVLDIPGHGRLQRTRGRGTIGGGVTPGLVRCPRILSGRRRDIMNASTCTGLGCLHWMSPVCASRRRMVPASSA